MKKNLEQNGGAPSSDRYEFKRARRSKPQKVVITAAGLGTRLLPMTKELPKEMLPLYMVSQGRLILKPLLQALFEQLFGYGLRNYCFVVGRSKRAIEDHFTPDIPFVENLGSSERSRTEDLITFYNMIKLSNILWINQPEAWGFGHAVSMSKPYVGSEPFLLTAGDTLVLSKNKPEFLNRMFDAFENSNAAVILLLQQVRDPRAYGVASYFGKRRELLRLSEVTEKPEKPKTDLAIMPFYIFTPAIFGAIDGIRPGRGGEIQLTDAIQFLIADGHEVLGVQLREDELRLDIGTPETYWEAQTASYQHSAGERDR